MKTVVTDEFLLPFPIVQNRNMNLNETRTNVYVPLIKAKPLKGLLKTYNSFVIIPFITHNSWATSIFLDESVENC